MDAMISLINRARALQGYSALEHDDVEAMAAAWLVEFDRNRIPEWTYEDILQKLLDARTKDFFEGRPPRGFEAAAFVAIFDGYYKITFDHYCDDCRENWGTIYVVDPETDKIVKSYDCTHENGYRHPPKVTKR